MAIIIGNAQDVGSRARQEDYVSSLTVGEMQLAVLADGMGGYEGGDQASVTVTQGFIRFIEQQARKYPLISDLLIDAAYSANAQLAQLKQNAQSNMGSTLVAVLVRDNHAWWVSIGDSLLYLWRGGRLLKLNADHSHYQDLRQQVFLGQISTAQAANDPERNGLTSALTGREIRHVDISRWGIALNNGDLLLLASDGLETLSSEQIAQLCEQETDSARLANTLVQHTLQANTPHQDNISVLIIGMTDSNTTPVRPTIKKGLSSIFWAGLLGFFLGGVFSIAITQMLREKPVAAHNTNIAEPQQAKPNTTQ